MNFILFDTEEKLQVPQEPVVCYFHVRQISERVVLWFFFVFVPLSVKVDKENYSGRRCKNMFRVSFMIIGKI